MYFSPLLWDMLFVTCLQGLSQYIGSQIYSAVFFYNSLFCFLKFSYPPEFYFEKKYEYGFTFATFIPKPFTDCFPHWFVMQPLPFFRSQRVGGSASSLRTVQLCGLSTTLF